MSVTPTTPAQVSTREAPANHLVDPRGLRVAAGLTTLVLAAVLLTASVWLLVAQGIVFAIASGFGVRRSPYPMLFGRLIKPRLGPPAVYEDDRPPRFAQAVGLCFAVLGLIGYLSGASLLGSIATGLALAAAFLNAAFGFCLGCEIYLLLRRINPTKQDNSITEVTA